MAKITRYTLAVTVEESQKLKQIAVRNRTNVSAWIKGLLQPYLDKEHEQVPDRLVGESVADPTKEQVRNDK